MFVCSFSSYSSVCIIILFINLVSGCLICYCFGCVFFFFVCIFFLFFLFLVVCVLVLGGSGFVFYIDLCFSLQ